MHTSSRKVVLNKGYQDDNPIEGKSVRRKHTEVADDPVYDNPVYETLEEKSKPVQRSHRPFFALVIIACLISIIALLLTLLMLFGEMGEKCECHANQGKFTKNNLKRF